jgi:hypothetical protein
MAHRYISGAEANLILTKVASYVAGYLKSEGYRYQPPTEDGYMHKLVGPNEATIYLNVSGHTSGDRINISGGFNIGSGRTGSGYFVRPNMGINSEISVSLSRGEETIAREIQKRFLPVYMVELAAARKQRDANEAYHNAQLGNLQRLQNLAGDCRKLDCDAEKAYLLIGEVYGYIRATDNTASLELRCLTIKQAEEIINLLRKG